MAIDQDIPDGNKTENSAGEDSSPSQSTVEISEDGAVHLPEGVSISQDNVEQAGSDLIVTQDDGSQLVVEGYFASDTPPTIETADGGQIPGDLVESLVGPVAPGQVADAGTSIGAQPIGHIDKVDGEVIAIRSDGTEVELEIGDPIFQGDVLKSGEDGAVGVVLADDTTFSMANNGEMVLDEMVYDPGTQEGSMDVSIVKGVFTFVSGQIAKTDPDAMTLDTPVATIGIRGTQVGLDFADGKTLTTALMEESDGFVGEIVVTNDGGQQIINVAGQGTTVTAFAEPPSPIFSVTEPQIIELFGPALQYLPMEVGTGYDYGVQENMEDDEDLADMDLEELTEFETAAGGNDEEGGGEEEEEGGAGSTSEYESQEGSDELGTVIPEGVDGFEIPEPPEFVDDGDNSGFTAPDPVQEAPPQSNFNLGDDGEVFDRSGVTYDLDVTGGMGNDVISTGSGNDFIDGGDGDDVINAGAGDDSVVGGKGDDIISGGEGDDHLYAGEGNDVVDGGIGDDYIDAGTGQGNDEYIGGEGEDTIEFDSSKDGVVVDLEAGTATDNPDTQTSSDDNIDNDTLTGIENVITGEGDDIIRGDENANVIDAAAGDDIIEGRGGDDVIDGGEGSDTAYFSGSILDYTVTVVDVEGEDSYLTVEGPDGTDTVYGVETLRFYEGEEANDDGSYFTFDPTTGNLEPFYVNVEIDEDGDFSNPDATYDQDVSGGSGDNVISTGSGADNIDGGAGNDDISSGAGDDFVDGGAGDDTIDAGDGDDTVIGGEGNDDISGGAGDDYLYAGEGDDVVNGGSGDDYIDAGTGAGNDIYNGDAGNDTIEFDSTSDGVDVDLEAGTATDRADTQTSSDDNIDNDTITGIENVIGGAGDDIIRGDENANVIDGAGGDDTLEGRGGNDEIDGGAGDDTAEYSGTFDQYTITPNEDGSLTVDGPDGTDTLTNIETLAFENGSTYDVATGILHGSETADELEGSSGDDVMAGGDGADTLDGGEGDDTAVLQGTYNEYDIEGDEEELVVEDTVENRDGTDVLQNVETLKFSDGTSFDVETGVLHGTDGDDTLTGTQDEDIIDGGAGDDNITGSSGNDLIMGGDDNDTLYAQDGDDVVDGGDGNDLIIGGSGEGDDQYIGGEGNDTVSYESTTEGVVVNLEEGTATDAEGVDYIDNDTLSGIENVTGGSGSDVITGGDDANILIGGEGDDILTGGGGNDILDGGNGGSDTAVFSGNYDDYEITTNQDGSLTITDLVGSDGTDTVSNMETIQFADRTFTVTEDNGLIHEIDGTNRNETIQGTNANDAIDGSGGHDNIYGDSGNDIIEGGTGNDNMYGGSGDDTFVVNEGDGNDDFFGGDGTDRVVSEDGSGVTIDGNFNAGNSIEEIDANGGAVRGDNSNQTLDFTDTDLTDVSEIDGGGGHDTITGSAEDDVIRGGTGNDNLYGGSGDDTFVVNEGDGNDDFFGGDGTDRVVSEDGSGVTIDGNFNAGNSIEEIDANGGAVRGDNSNQTLDFTDTDLTDVSEIDGGGGHDTITGSAEDDVIRGGTGNDNLYGGSGDDTFVVNEGDGNDDFFGGDGTDRVVSEDGSGVTIDGNFNAGNSIEEIDANGGAVRGDNSNQTLDFTDTDLTDVSEIDGGGGHDTITGSAEDDVIRGGTGNDNLYGGSGDDTFVVNEGDGNDDFFGGDGTDRVVSEDGSGVTIDGNFNAGNSIEEIDANGGAVRGDNSNQTLDFTDTDLTDVSEIDGGGGHDTITGSAEDDVIRGGTGNDKLDGGEGDGDTVVFSGNYEDYQVTVNNNGSITVKDLVSSDGNDGTDTISNFEVVQFADVSYGIDEEGNFVSLDAEEEAPAEDETRSLDVNDGESVDIDLEEDDGEEKYFTLEQGPEDGTLTLDGVELAEGAIFSESDLANGDLEYTADEFTEQNSEWDASTPSWMVNSNQDSHSVNDERGTEKESNATLFGGGNSLSSWDGIGLTAFSLNDSYTNLDGTLNLDGGTADITYRNGRGLGVDGDLDGGNGTQASYQINHVAEDASNDSAGKSEALALNLGQEVSSARVGISSMFKNESEGEKGFWEAFDADGNSVGSGILDTTTVDYTNSHEGFIDIGLDDVSDPFQHLVFTAAPYSDDTTVTNDSSDITIKSVEFDVAGESALDANLSAPDDASSVDVTYEGSLAGYENVMGMYKIGDDGTMSDFEVLWDNVKDEVADGSTTSTVNLEGGEDIGFFLIANEGDWFSNGNNFSEGMSFTMNEDNSLTLDQGNGNTVDFDSSKVFTTSNGGSDDVMDVASGVDGDGNLWIGFEDQVNGDKDFNDVMISLNYNVDTAGAADNKADQFVVSVADQNPSSDGYDSQDDPEVTFNINITDIA